MANNQSVRRHLDAFTRGRIIGKLEEGRSVTSVAAEFGIAHSIVSRLWRQFQTTGKAIRGFSSGRPRGTTPADDRYIVLQARRNRRQTAGEIARHTTQATGRPKSRFTVARRLHGGGLFARRPVRCVPLTPAHRRRRSLWCREHRNWRDNEWGRVLFIDESRFSLSSDSHRILIWRERGSRNHPSNIIERDRYGGRGVLVWGGIMLGSRTDLHIFDTGSVNGTRYCNEILLPYVRLFRGAMGLQFLFMDDNAPCHRTVAAKQLLESEDIERMDWPARSPDLNPIEHVWDFLGRRLAARTLPPVTIRELGLALQDEWAAMPQQLIGTLILSMGRRCETCLAVSGEIMSPTKDRMFLAGHPSQGCFGLQSHRAPCYFFNKASFYPSDFSFTGDLDESPDPSMSKIVLRDLIISSKYYKEEEAKELLEVITAERLETEQQQKLKRQEQLSIEKLRLEIELSRNANQYATQNNGQTSRVKSLDEIVKMVRFLTVKVPNKSDGWDYFFSSLEKAFASENVSDELRYPCKHCDFYSGFSSSKKTLNCPEVNTRFVYGMRQIGKGFSAGFKLCGTLNLSRLSKTAYTNHENKLMSVISEVNELSMQKAASELLVLHPTKNKIVECGISVDGT
ncbi:transposable element Tcb2 transposase [Trichonephila clavipes]|nr:transposable element Tcb2 transposase [Trichonephila clavipes]